MRIDAHQHFWRFIPAEYPWIDARMGALARDFLPADLKPLLDAEGFRASVAVQARQTLDETIWLLDLADAHAFVAGVVGWVDLLSADVERDLERLSSRRKLVGVRHVAQAEPDDFLMRPSFLRGLGLLDRYGLAYDILIYPRQLQAAAECAARLPSQRFVLDHLAKPQVRAGEIDDWRRGLRELARLPNVCCKLSGLVTEADWQAWTPAQLRPYIDVAFELFGADRLMIGSDWPVCTLAATYGRAMRVITDYLVTCTASERAAVLGGTAARFWNLAVQETS